MNKIIKSITAFALTLAILSGCSDDDVIGLNDAAKYGNIEMTFSGTRSDNVAFSSKMNYRFIPEEGFYYSEIYKNDTYNQFYVQRQHGAVNASHNDNYAYMYLSVDTSDNTPDLESSYFGVYTSLLFDDNVYFYLSDYYYFSEGDITSYSYNEDSGKLTVKFTKVIDAADNTTNHDLTITGTVNVTVFESLNGDS